MNEYFLVNGRKFVEEAPASAQIRVRHDWDRKRWNFLPRNSPLQDKPVKLNEAPETCRLMGDTGQVLLPPSYVRLVREVINSERAGGYALAAARGWRNKGDANKVEQITFGGAEHDVIRVDGDKVYIRHLYTNQPAPVSLDASLMPLWKNITKEGAIHDPPHAPVRILVIARPGVELWLPRDDVIFL